MKQPLIELAGEPGAPPLHLFPANGFPPLSYLPFARQFSRHRCLCLPPRPLWHGQEPPGAFEDWNVDARILGAGIEEHGLRDIVAVGHSLGGVVSMLALIQEPIRFKALVMLDPPILLPHLLALVRQAWQGGFVDQIPLVQAAKRRRRHFASRQEAFERFRGKAIFADWNDEALWLYIEHGTRLSSSGGYELVWSVEWEAHYFSTVHEGIWDDLPKLEGLAPVLLVRGQHSHTLVSDAFERARSLAPSADLVEMAGQDHLFPLSAPEATAQLIKNWLATL